MRAVRGWILASVVLAGCGSAPQQTAADARRERLIELNDSGRRAVVAGELKRAAVYYREALRLAEETEDFRGIAINALNLAATRQALGEAELAQRTLDRISKAPAQFDRRYVAEAAGWQALLALQAGQLDAAERWLAQAENGCAAPACADRTALINMRGQLVLERGDAAGARDAAARALAASRSEGNREEEANALRLDGRAAARLGEPAFAADRLNEALQIDKQLALPQKIALDLLALGEAGLARGDVSAARDYARRALEVSRASGNRTQQEAALRLLERAR